MVLFVLLLTGPLGYNFGLVPLEPSLVSLLIALAGGILVALVGIIYLIIAVRSKLAADRNLIAVAIILGLLPSIFVLPQMS